jgi:hypothetical protein
VVGLPLAAGFAGCAPGSDDLPITTTTGGSTQNVPEAGDALPGGAISFFNKTSCPEGWTPFADGAGRVPVPTVGEEPPLAMQGEPLADGEDRLHNHAVEATADVGSASFAGIAGESNHGVAGQQKVTIAAAAEKTSSGLPYVQLLACKKLGEPRPGAAPLPPGLLMFWNGTSCPEGFEQPIATQGRVLVGLPKDAPPGLSFGGTSLKPGEGRPHGHAVSGTFTTTSHGIALASGCCADGYAKDGAYPYAGSTDETNIGLPTIELLQCQKK